MRLLAILAALLALAAAPVAAAQNSSADPPDVYVTGEQPGPQQSLEDDPGISYGILVVVGVVGFAAVLAFAARRERRDRRGRP